MDIQGTNDNVFPAWQGNNKETISGQLACRFHTMCPGQCHVSASILLQIAFAIASRNVADWTYRVHADTHVHPM